MSKKVEMWSILFPTKIKLIFLVKYFWKNNNILFIIIKSRAMRKLIWRIVTL